MSTIKWTTWNEDDEEVVHRLPARWAICDRCRGDGTHDHPAFNGFTSSEWAEACHDDPDWPEDYMRGRYSVACEECHGSGKVREVDPKHCDEELLRAYEQERALHAQWDYEDAYTRRMEGGWR